MTGIPDKVSDHIYPYCVHEMQPGAILGEAYRVKWERADGKWWQIWPTSIGESSLLGRPRVYGYRCLDCIKIIIDA
jgi:hypothetical protein